MTASPRPTTQGQGSPGRARRWAWLVILIAGVGLFELMRLLYATTGNPNLFPSLLLLAAVVMPASFAAFMYGLRLQFQVRLGAVLCVGLLGGAVGVLASGLFGYDTLRDLGILPTIAVAIIEETAKLFVPAAFLFLSRRPKRLADGLILGVACGAGFAVLETLGYSSVELIRSRENLGEVVQLLLQRGLFSPATHMAWTGLTTTALWYAVGCRWRRHSTPIAIGVFAVVVGLHALWDSTTDLAGYIVLATASLTLIGAVVRVASTRPLARLTAVGASPDCPFPASSASPVFGPPNPSGGALGPTGTARSDDGVGRYTEGARK